MEDKDRAGISAELLMRNVTRFLEKDAKDIMTHRMDIVAIDETETLDNAIKFMLDESYSRFPIYREDIDEIIGTIHLRDAVTCFFGGTDGNTPICQLTDYIRPVAYIPETKAIDRLFKEMQAEKNHIAIVIDEYGQTSGLVAMEDILEEIVGDIMDEYDEEEDDIEVRSDGTLEVNGLSELEDLEDLLPITFDKDEYETLNGFLISQLERIPSEDEHCSVVYKDYMFTILEVDNNVIQSVKIEKV